jgi:hypothetical protein
VDLLDIWYISGQKDAIEFLLWSEFIFHIFFLIIIYKCEKVSNDWQRKENNEEKTNDIGYNFFPFWIQSFILPKEKPDTETKYEYDFSKPKYPKYIWSGIRFTSETDYIIYFLNKLSEYIWCCYEYIPTTSDSCSYNSDEKSAEYFPKYFHKCIEGVILLIKESIITNEFFLIFLDNLWTLYKEYGNGRKRVETLVAMKTPS